MFRTTSSFRTPVADVCYELQTKKIIEKIRHGYRNDKIELNKQDVRDEICSEDRK